MFNLQLIVVERSSAKYTNIQLGGGGGECETGVLFWFRTKFQDMGFDMPCGSIRLTKNEAVNVIMEWGAYYSVSGETFSSTNPSAVNIQGKMINPEDVKSLDAVKLADSGDNSVRHNLAVRYLERKEHFDTAVKWLQAAAEEGYTPSQYQLAICYTSGACNVKKDLEVGYFWCALAAGNRASLMSEERDKMEKQLAPEVVKQVKKRVEEWKKAHPPNSFKQ